MHLTGQENYMGPSKALCLDPVSNPDQITNPFTAARAAALRFKAHDLNKLADQERFVRVCAIINGGKKDKEAREAFYNKAVKLFK